MVGDMTVKEITERARAHFIDALMSRGVKVEDGPRPGVLLIDGELVPFGCNISNTLGTVKTIHIVVGVYKAHRRYLVHHDGSIDRLEELVEYTLQHITNIRLARALGAVAPKDDMVEVSATPGHVSLRVSQTVPVSQLISILQAVDGHGRKCRVKFQYDLEPAVAQNVLSILKTCP
jgi:hypothetical protein